MKPYALKKQ